MPPPHPCSARGLSLSNGRSRARLRAVPSPKPRAARSGGGKPPHVAEPPGRAALALSALLRNKQPSWRFHSWRAAPSRLPSIPHQGLFVYEQPAVASREWAFAAMSALKPDRRVRAVAEGFVGGAAAARARSCEKRARAELTRSSACGRCANPLRTPRR